MSPEEKSINAKFKRIQNIVENELYTAANNMAKSAIKQLSIANKTYNQKLINEQSKERKRVGKELEIDVFKESKHLEKILAASVKENVKLIKDIPNKMIRRVSEEVLKSHKSGLRSEVLGKKLAEQMGIGDRRAKLIARDQLASLNGELTRARQTENGVESFIWRTVGDERVRDEHEELNGEEFSWKSGAPSEGFPGEPINCRCYAEPVF